MKRVDITNLGLLIGDFPVRLMELGFIHWQVMDEHDRDTAQYIEPPMVTIPAGSFFMGMEIEPGIYVEKNETPQHVVVLEEFAIGIYPLTVAEYACFLLATNQLHRVNESSLRWRRDHPMVNLSWDDAIQYVNWLAEVTSLPYRLPTEAEWEKAARGTDKRIYPWGYKFNPQHANTRENNLRSTTAVGNYPGGVGPYGCLDLAGNIWEWTNSLYRPYPYNAADGREALDSDDSFPLRVQRGGSWRDPATDARVTFRFPSDPSESYNVHARFQWRINSCGVRLAMGSAV